MRPNARNTLRDERSKAFAWPGVSVRVQRATLGAGSFAVPGGRHHRRRMPGVLCVVSTLSL